MDRVLRRFLENTAADALALQARSDVLSLEPVPPVPASTYLCRFQVPYLKRLPSGTVVIDPGPVACCIRFPADYLRPGDWRLLIRVATVLTPGLLHPNVRDGVVCLGGAFSPGTPIHGVVWQLFEIITYQEESIVVDERDALDPEACRLLRAYPDLVHKLSRPRLYRPRRPAEAEP